MNGKRICIRPFKEKDIELYKDFLEGDYLWKEFDGPYFGPMTDEDVKSMLEHAQKLIANVNNENASRMVIADLATDTLIGTVSWYYESKETMWVDTGICLYDDRHWSKGIGKEAFGLWIDHMLNCSLNLARIGYHTWSGNIGMMRIGEKLNLQLEACYKDARYVNGNYYDAIGYGITKGQWKELYPEGFYRSL